MIFVVRRVVEQQISNKRGVLKNVKKMIMLYFCVAVCV